MSSAMATDEENCWSEAAAAFDGGKGLPLEEIDPDDKDEMQLLYQALQVNDYSAQLRLKRYIRKLRPLGPSQQTSAGGGNWERKNPRTKLEDGKTYGYFPVAEGKLSLVSYRYGFLVAWTLLALFVLQ